MSSLDKIIDKFKRNSDNIVSKSDKLYITCQSSL